MIPINPLVGYLQRPLNKYMNFVGIWQTYSVFAPPRSNNLHLIAIVTYKDGTTRIYPLPRVDRMPLFDKVRKERFRKYLEDNAAWTEVYGSFLVKDLARYIGRESDVFKGSQANPPHSVSLIRLHSELPVMRAPANGLSSNPLARAPNNRPHTDMKLILHYYLSEDDLK